jgi:histidine triad (HIT) family protein
MSLNGQYDSQNIFAMILRGEAPAYKIYEDADVLAFLDIFPQSRGHVTRVIVDELQPDGVQIAQFNGAPAGQTVYHIHVHIIPRWEGEAPGVHGQGKADPQELEALQARLVERIRSVG